MNILTNKEYTKVKHEFLKKHVNWGVDTSPMDADGKYVKTYTCTDGAQLIEVNRPVYEDVEFEVKGVKIKTSVKLFESEMWNTDDANSVFTYEKF